MIVCLFEVMRVVVEVFRRGGCLWSVSGVCVDTDLGVVATVINIIPRAVTEPPPNIGERSDPSPPKPPVNKSSFTLPSYSEEPSI